MDVDAFETDGGTRLSAVTAEEMRSVDRVAVDTVGLPLLSMMENAGRNLATVVETRRGDEPVVVFAGAGGNGGGGLACARHLSNRGVPVTVVLDRDPEELAGAPERQHQVLEAAGVAVREEPPTRVSASVAVDALVGYGLSEALGGRPAELANACGDAEHVVALDVPSGVDATTADVPGPAVDADTTLTLALPKTGLGANAGELRLGDIGIPAAVYADLGIPYESPFGDGPIVSVRATRTD
jgi:NAD(P)H-hydrate epimerase